MDQKKKNNTFSQSSSASVSQNTAPARSVWFHLAIAFPNFLRQRNAYAAEEPCVLSNIEAGEAALAVTVI